MSGSSAQPGLISEREHASDRRQLLALTIVIVAGLATRFSAMKLSLWLDESWVANSVLAPSISQMLHYDRWVQTTPPLFLLGVRAFAKLFGNSELVLRMFPWICGAASVVLVTSVLRRMFDPLLALLGSTFFLTNYWAVKLAQEVKQYSADLLVSSLMVLLIWRYLLASTRKLFWGMLFAGAAGIFLSYTTVFFYPAVIIAVFLRAQPNSNSTSGSKWRDCLLLLAAYACSVGICNWWFIRPNRSAKLLHSWALDYIGSGGLLSSGGRYFHNVAHLLVPPAFPWLRPLSYIVAGLTIVGFVRSVISIARKEPRGVGIAVSASLPILTCTGVSLLRQYPVLTYPRLIFWMLSLCTILILYGAEPVWRFFARSVAHNSFVPLGIAAAVCLAIVYLSYRAATRRAQYNDEDTRAAVRYLEDHAGAQDGVFVDGGSSEQFKYYFDMTQWHPTRMYLSNTGWPCCPRNVETRATNPRAQTLQEDLKSFTAMAGRGRAWLLVPFGKPGLWSSTFPAQLQSLPADMERLGWRSTLTQDFSNVRVYGFECSRSTCGSSSALQGKTPGF